MATKVGDDYFVNGHKLHQKVVTGSKADYSSPVWQHYRFCENEQSYCIHCMDMKKVKSFSSNSSTDTLSKHISNKHKEIISVKPRKQQKTLEQTVCGFLKKLIMLKTKPLAKNIPDLYKRKEVSR